MTQKENLPNKPWSAFEFIDYRILWASAITAMFTMNLRVIVTGIWLYEETGSGFTLAWLGILEFVMRIPANLYGGALADQIDRKKIIIFCQLASFVVMTILTLLLFVEKLEIWHVYSATALLSATSVMSHPSRSALTANVVPKTYLVHAVATNTITMQISTIILPVIFWITSLTPTLTLTFGVTAFFGLLSFIIPFYIKTSGSKHLEIKKNKSTINNIIDGLKYVISHPILPGLYLLDISVTVVSFYRQLFPIFADQLYKGGRATVSILTGANSIGGILGSLLVVQTAKYQPKGMLVLYATLIYAILFYYNN